MSVSSIKLFIDDCFMLLCMSKQEVLSDKGPMPLPVLCIEDGKVILRFSEIFGIHGPVKKREKRDHKYFVPKGMWHIKDYPQD